MKHRLGCLLVTPRAHGIHHSQMQRETDTNFGVVLTLWDRLHRTLRLNVPQQALTIGVPMYPEDAEMPVTRLLALPWARPEGSVPDPAAPTGPVDVLVP